MKYTDLGVDRVKGVLSVDESCSAALALHFRNGMHRQGRLAAALWTKDLRIKDKMQCQATNR